MTRAEANDAIAAYDAAREVGATFSLHPGSYAARVEAAFSPFQRSPELRLAIAQVAKQRAQRLGAEWLEKAAVLRTARDIVKEQRMREALGFDERLNAYLPLSTKGRG